ncbi:MAG: ATP-binding protein [Gammaproteobacteria bacterium]|nr:ATP-binding protein [Gammaproteobacteria bacterium]
MTDLRQRVVAGIPAAEWLPQLVARVRATVHTKLLVAFLGIVVMLVALGAVGLRVLQESNQRAESLVNLQQKIAAYRQLQDNTTEQLYTVVSALLTTDQSTLDAMRRQLNQFAYDFDRAQFVAHDEIDLLNQIEADYAELIRVGTDIIELTRAGKLAEGRELQRKQAIPLADRLERYTNSLVNKAEADMISSAEVSNQAYITSQTVVIGVALVSIILALVLGYAISWSLVGPVKRMDARFKEIARGEFSGGIEVANRDELGDLAENLNNMSEELGRLYREIEATSRHKSEFLANMSHELRTPLNAIIGFSEVLAERMFGELNEKQAEYIQDIHESGQHLLSLINDILDLSKVEAGRMELELSKFDIGAALENAFTLVKERMVRHGVNLDVELAPDLGDMVGDQRKFKQILLNLLSNAVKFTNEGGRVKVEAARMSDRLEVTVSDTGIGISSEDQRVIFEEFRQVSSDHGKTSEGTGLGLTLTKKFVEMHGGKIWVDSKIGKGSTFGFSLPLTPSESIQALTTSSDEAVAN